MPVRVAAVTSFVVFAVCLIAGLDNTFGTAVSRALEAMAGTLALGLIVGWMGQKMIEENVNQQRPKTAPDAVDVPVEPISKTDNKGAKTAAKKVAANAPKRGR